jgi:hypothetical protein
MGWDFCQDWKRPSDVIDMLVQSYTSNGGKVLAKGVAREQGQYCAWFAVESSQGVRMAVVALLEKDGRNGYGFKEMSEDMGPYYWKVPENVWDAVKDSPPLGESSVKWRAKVCPVGSGHP